MGFQCFFCSVKPTKKAFQQFCKSLDKADKEHGNKYDSLLMWNGEYEEVGNDFYVCENHMDKITCFECKRILTRHQIQNAIQTNVGSQRDHYNLFLTGPRGQNFGKELKPACTDCWIQHDSELRAELEEGYANE